MNFGQFGNLNLGSRRAVSSVSAYLDGAINSAVAEWYPGDSGSYPGSGQTLFNLIENPADGSDQSAYDFWLGADGNASTDDPTFSTDKFTFDGGDYFTLKDVSLAIWLNNSAKTDGTIAGGTYLGVWTVPATVTKTWATMFGGPWLQTDAGVLFSHDTDSLRSFASGGTGSGAVATDISTLNAEGQTKIFIALGWNPNSTTGNMKAALGTASWGATHNVTFPANATNTISSVNEKFFIGAGSNANAAETNTIIESGWEFHWGGFANKLLTDAELADVVAYIEGKLGDVTP